jgi:hypothetical protein
MRLTQRKGDSAVAQAIATFTSNGWDVSIPLTESAPYDLIVDTGKYMMRVQVKYSASGKEVGLRRVHSNSKGYVVKKPQTNSFDWLYVLTGAGEEFLITRALSGQSCVTPRPHDTFASVFARFVVK